MRSRAAGPCIDDHQGSVLAGGFFMYSTSGGFQWESPSGNQQFKFIPEGVLNRDASIGGLEEAGEHAHLPLLVRDAHVQSRRADPAPTRDARARITRIDAILHPRDDQRAKCIHAQFIRARKGMSRSDERKCLPLIYFQGITVRKPRNPQCRAPISSKWLIS